jgi:hypothetical protein
MKIPYLSPRASALFLFLALSGCGGSDEEEFEFGKADMESALHGTWVGTWSPADGSDAVPFELVIRAPREPGTRMACGTRILADGEVGLSPQCVTVTQLAVSATATIGDGDTEPVELDGYASTDSRIFSHADFDLAGEDAPFRLVALWESDKGFSHCVALTASGLVVANYTLDERR